MRELRAGLWHWQAPHPQWTPGQRWPREVSSCALDDREPLLLLDPLAVPQALLTLARERRPVIVLTALNEWLRGGVTRRQVLDGLRPLLARPVEVVLPAHGPPSHRAALEQALCWAKLMAAKDTPATRAATTAGVSFAIHESEHDPSAASYALEAAGALAVDPARVLKTLVVTLREGLAACIVSSDATLDLRRSKSTPRWRSRTVPSA